MESKKSDLSVNFERHQSEYIICIERKEKDGFKDLFILDSNELEWIYENYAKFKSQDKIKWVADFNFEGKINSDDTISKTLKKPSWEGYKKTTLGALLKRLNDNDEISFGSFFYKKQYLQDVLILEDLRNFKFFIPTNDLPLLIKGEKWWYSIAPIITLKINIADEVLKNVRH